MESIKALFAWLRSWRKPADTWALDDYPVRVRLNGGGETGYVAQIINWYVPIGLGETREEALADLRARFKEATDRPRPGSKVPIQFAESGQVDDFGAWGLDVVEEITGIRPFFVSDGSSLSDFAADDGELASFVARVRELYGVDISDVEHGHLVTVFERIAATGRGPSSP